MRALLSRKRTLGVTAAALMVVASAAACSDESGESNGNDGDAIADPESFMDWETCEVFDNLDPIVDLMEIEHFELDAGEISDLPGTSVPGQGLDQASATCFGEAHYGSVYFDTLDDEREANGRIEIAVSPWNDAEEAQYWHEDSIRTAEDFFEATSDDHEEFEIEGDWDEGVFFTQTDSGGSHHAIFRSSSLDIRVIVNYPVDTAVITYEQMTTDGGIELEGEPEDYQLYDFDPDEVEEWVLETYIHEVHDIVMEEIGEGAN